MSDYSAVAPPTNFSQSSAFAAALQRARQIAAKINPSAAETTGQKRPLEDGSGMDCPEPDTKKVAAVNDSAPQLAALRGQQVTSPQNSNNPTSAAAQAAAQAAAVAARVGAVSGGSSLPGMGVPLGIGLVQNEDIKVPDKMVGLIIGRGGEQITRLQNESGCKIQMAPDSGGMPERVCTLTGTREAINRAKDLVMSIVQQRSRTEGPGMGDMMGGGGGGGGGSGGMGGGGPPGGGGGGGHSHVEIMIPGPKVGLIIGKGGETIKQLQEKSGAKMVVIQDGPAQEQEKPLRITGDPQKVEYAKQLVYDLIAEKEMQRRDNDMGRGRGRGGPNAGMGGPPFGNRGGGEYGNGGGWDRRPGGMQQGQMDKAEATFTIPASKCGIVIGRGGETIKQINQQSGAHCELDRRPAPNPNEKVFLIRGMPEQIEQAKRIISEKIGMPPGPGGPPATQYPIGQGPPGGQGPPQHFAPQGWGGYQPWQGQQHPQDPNAAAAAAAAAAATGNPGGTGQVQVNPQTGQPDYSLQWAEYYRSLGMHREADMIEQQAKSMQQPQQQPPQQQPQQQPPAQPNVAQNGQPDYSAQWAEYYRSIGKIKEAEAIEASMKNKPTPQPGPGGPGGPQQPQPGSGAPQPGGPGAPQQPQQAPYGQPYPYQAVPGYYGGAPGPQPPQQPGPQQTYSYPAYGAYGGQPENQ